MKKILPVSLVVLALAAGSAVYLHQKPKLDARAASAATSYLPAETVLLLALPNPGQTMEDWKGTDLYKIWSEPQVQAFLAKPLSKIPPNQELHDTLAQIEHLEPKNLFIAVTSLDEKDSQPHVVAGFEFKGASADVDKLLAGAKDSLREKFPAGKADLINYQGHSIEMLDAGKDLTLASVYVGQWYLLGNDLVQLKATVDRLDHRAPANDATLDKAADFQAVSAKLPKNHASLIFARPQSLFTKIFALAAASGQVIDPAQRAEVDKIKAFGASTSIDQGKMRDTVYVLAPGYKHPEKSLGYGGLGLSSAETILYTAGLLNLPDKYDLPANMGAPNVAGTKTLDDLMTRLLKAFQDKGRTLIAEFLGGFGREFSLLIDWPANSAQPSLLASLDVRDPALAGKFMDTMSTALAENGEWQTTQDKGRTLHTLKQTNVPFLSPTFTLTDKHLVLGLNSEGVSAALGREKSGGANFTSGEAYKKSAATVAKGDTGFGYVDSRIFFERLYGGLKPMAVMGLMLYPQAGDYIDVSKLPDTETIAKHLSPIVFSQSSDGQGVLMESVGPLTFLQAGVGVGGAALTAVIPYVQKQYGATVSPTPAAGDAKDDEQ